MSVLLLEMVIVASPSPSSNRGHIKLRCSPLRNLIFVQNKQNVPPPSFILRRRRRRRRLQRDDVLVNLPGGDLFLRKMSLFFARAKLITLDFVVGEIYIFWLKKIKKCERLFTLRWHVRKWTRERVLEQVIRGAGWKFRSFLSQMELVLFECVGIVFAVREDWEHDGGKRIHEETFIRL